MTEISFTIPGRIGGKGRHRARIARGKHGQQFVQTYSDAKTRNLESLIRSFAADAMRGKSLLQGPVKFEVTAWVSYPSSWSKKRKAASTWVTGKPDASNIQKALEDGMNGICYRDDSQIACINFARVYTDGAEQAFIKLTELNGAVG